MNVYDSIMTGLNEAVAYEKGVQTAHSATITIAPIPSISAAEIKALRKNLNMTQNIFAAVLGVSIKTVEAWEKGTNSPAGTARRMMSMLCADSKLPEKYNIISR